MIEINIECSVCKNSQEFQVIANDYGDITITTEPCEQCRLAALGAIREISIIVNKSIPKKTVNVHF